MNIESRTLFAEGERAVRRDDLAAARAAFVAAAEAALAVQLWRSALRCYRHALELDLLDSEIVAKVLQVSPRVISGRGWDEYRVALDAKPAWPHFSCRAARTVIGDLGAIVECPDVGPVLELIMSDADLVETRPDGRFVGMPIAMSLIILRRAMWPVPMERDSATSSLRVGYDGRQHVMLDELGDWEPLTREREGVRR